MACIKVNEDFILMNGVYNETSSMRKMSNYSHVLIFNSESPL